MRIAAIFRYSGVASATFVSSALAGHRYTIASSNVTQRIWCEIAFDCLIVFIGCVSALAEGVEWAAVLALDSRGPPQIESSFHRPRAPSYGNGACTCPHGR